MADTPPLERPSRQSRKASAASRPARRTSLSIAPEDSRDDRRDRILRAAINEFGQYGLAGARTDAIASAAGVNKALLYYYFHSKSELYAAALEASAAQMLESALRSLQHEGTAGERLLRSALNHFDRIASQHEYRQLVHQEMARLREGAVDEVPQPIATIFGVLMSKMRQVLKEGMKTGELIRTDWMQVIYSVLGANVFYFLSAPMMQRVADFDPLLEKEILRRRKAALTFLGATLFSDREHGEQLARRVAADTPIPPLGHRWQFPPSGVRSR